MALLGALGRGVGDIRVLVSMDGVDSVLLGMKTLDRGLMGLGLRAGPMMAVNAALTGTAAAVGAAAATMATAAGIAAKFETSMVGIGIVADKSGAELAALGDDLQSLSIEVGQSSNSLADALRLILGSGIIETSDAFHVLEVAARGAVAGFTTTQTVAAALTATLKSYDLSVAETQRVSDVFFKTVEQGVITTEQLAMSIGEVLPFASQANVTIEQLGAAIGTLTVQGVGASESITALRSLFARVPEMAENARKAGLSFDALRATAGGLPTLLDEITRATGGNALALDKLIPRIEAKLAVLKLIGPGEKELARQLEGVANAAGSTEEAFERVAQTVGQAYQQFKAKLNVAFQDLGANLLPAVSGGFDSLSASIPRLVESLALFIPDFIKLVELAGSFLKLVSDALVNLSLFKAAVAEQRGLSLVPIVGPILATARVHEAVTGTTELAGGLRIANVELERFRIEQQRAQQAGEALFTTTEDLSRSINQVGFSFHGVNASGAEFSETTGRLPAILGGATANLIAFKTGMGGAGAATEDTAKKMAAASRSIARALEDMRLEVAGELGEEAMEKIRRETEDLVLEIREAQKEFGKERYPDTLIGQAHLLGEQKLEILRDSLRDVNLSAEEIEKRLANANRIAMGGLALGTPVAPTAQVDLPLILRGARELNEITGDYTAGQERITAEQEKQADLWREAADRAGELAQTFDNEVAQAFSNVLSVGLDFLGNIEDGVVSVEDLRGGLIGVGQILGNLGGLAGAFGKALAGAAAGSKFGVPGAIVGGVAGLISGALGIGDGKKEAERHANAMRKLAEAAERLGEAFEGAVPAVKGQAEALSKAIELFRTTELGKFEKGTVGLAPELKQLMLAAGLTEEEIRNLRAAMNDAREEGLDPVAFAVEYLTGVLQPFEDRLASLREGAEQWLASTRFELDDITDSTEQAQILLEEFFAGLPSAVEGAGALGFEIPALAGLGAEDLRTIEADLRARYAVAVEAGDEASIALLQVLIPRIDALGDAAAEAAGPVERLMQAFASEEALNAILGTTDSLADFGRAFQESFPIALDDMDAAIQSLVGNIAGLDPELQGLVTTFKTMFDGIDLTSESGAQAVISNLVGVYSVWADLTEAQQGAFLKALNMTEEEFLGLGGRIRGIADQARAEFERERAARERQQRETRTARRDIAARAEAIGRPTTTQVTIEAEPILQDIAGTNRSLLALLNTHVPSMDEKLGQIAIARPGDVNRALGESFLFDTLKAR